MKVNNFIVDKESLSLGESEKENSSLLKNIVNSGEDEKSLEEDIEEIEPISNNAEQT